MGTPEREGSKPTRRRRGFQTSRPPEVYAGLTVVTILAAIAMMRGATPDRVAAAPVEPAAITAEHEARQAANQPALVSGRTAIDSRH